MMAKVTDVTSIDDVNNEQAIRDPSFTPRPILTWNGPSVKGFRIAGKAIFYE